MHNSHIDTDSTQSATYYLVDEAATLALGMRIAGFLHAGLVIYLSGNLGAGKTTFARGILHGLGYRRVVKSPTYNLVEIYKFSRLYFYHFDFYRFNNYSEWEEAGFREYFNAESICLVEWPEKAGQLLPAADLHIYIELLESGRKFEIKAETEAGKRCLIYLQDLGDF